MSVGAAQGANPETGESPFEHMGSTLMSGKQNARPSLRSEQGDRQLFIWFGFGEPQVRRPFDAMPNNGEGDIDSSRLSNDVCTHQETNEA